MSNGRFVDSLQCRSIRQRRQMQATINSPTRKVWRSVNRDIYLPVGRTRYNDERRRSSRANFKAEKTDYDYADCRVYGFHSRTSRLRRLPRRSEVETINYAVHSHRQKLASRAVSSCRLYCVETAGGNGMVSVKTENCIVSNTILPVFCRAAEMRQLLSQTGHISVRQQKMFA